MSRRLLVVVLLQVLIIALAVAPRLSARLTGDEYPVLVRPIDPIDPFRGAYVDLDYDIDGETRAGRVWVPLRRDGEHYRGGTPQVDRPEGPALRCHSEGYGARCGIESYFASQAAARRLERELADTGAVATIRIDGAGRAAIVDLQGLRSSPRARSSE